MMFFIDMVFVQDKKMFFYVQKYVKDNDVFFKDFFVVVFKFFEFGVLFVEGIENICWILKFIWDEFL